MADGGTTGPARSRAAPTAILNPATLLVRLPRGGDGAMPSWRRGLLLAALADAMRLWGVEVRVLVFAGPSGGWDALAPRAPVKCPARAAEVLSAILEELASAGVEWVPRAGAAKGRAA